MEEKLCWFCSTCFFDLDESTLDSGHQCEILVGPCQEQSNVNGYLKIGASGLDHRNLEGGLATDT